MLDELRTFFGIESKHPAHKIQQVIVLKAGNKNGIRIIYDNGFTDIVFYSDDQELKINGNIDLLKSMELLINEVTTNIFVVNAYIEHGDFIIVLKELAPFVYKFEIGLVNELPFIRIIVGETDINNLKKAIQNVILDDKLLIN